MRQKLPILAGIGTLLLALVFVIVAGTVQTVRAYGTGTHAVTSDVTALDLVRNNLVSVFSTRLNMHVTGDNSFAFTEENYLLGTSTCDSTREGQYFFTTQLTGSKKLAKQAPYMVAQTIQHQLSGGYEATVKSAGNGDIPQVIVRDKNKKLVGTILVVLSDLYTTRHNITISGSLSTCHPLGELPKTSAQDLEDRS